MRTWISLLQKRSICTMPSSKEKSSLADQICLALKNKQRVEFVYNGKKRVAEPQSCGVSTAGNEVARFYLVEGGSRPEQLFTVSQITNFKILDQQFTKPGPNYQKDDSAMKDIYCQL